jgi:hypothetical protein
MTCRDSFIIGTDGPASEAARPEIVGVGPSTVSRETRNEPSGIQDGGDPVALFTRCGWCKAVMVEGPLSPDGLESTGVCAKCMVREFGRVLNAIAPVAPAGDRTTTSDGRSGPLEGPLVSRPVNPVRHDVTAARYEIVDANGVRIVQGLVGANAAAAIAHILNEGLEHDGICVKHLQVNRIDGTCFSCEHGFAASPYAVAR